MICELTSKLIYTPCSIWTLTCCKLSEIEIEILEIEIRWNLTNQKKENQSQV